MAKAEKPDDYFDSDALEAAELVLYQVSECYVYLVISPSPFHLHNNITSIHTQLQITGSFRSFFFVLVFLIS